jgi:hypothetical protein
MTWRRIDGALRHGAWELAGGDSLPRLLARERGATRSMRWPPLTVEQILRWADEHRHHTGKLPTRRSGAVRGAPRPETWLAIDAALRHGSRGLPVGNSLKQLLHHHGRTA